jgi:hypothetical protein
MDTLLLIGVLLLLVVILALWVQVTKLGSEECFLEGK